MKPSFQILLCVNKHNFTEWLRLWNKIIQVLLFFFFPKTLLIGEGREKERERNINAWPPPTHTPTGDLSHNPGMYPDWDSNRWPFSSQASARSIQPHQPELNFCSFNSYVTLGNFTFLILSFSLCTFFIGVGGLAWRTEHSAWHKINTQSCQLLWLSLTCTGENIDHTF